MTLMQNRTRAFARRFLAINNLNREKCMLFEFSRYILEASMLQLVHN